MRYANGILFLIALSFLLGAGCRRTEVFVDEATVFSALAGGSEFSLVNTADEIRYVVLNFYAPDCPPCEKEVPALRAFAARHRSDATIRFVAIGSSLRAIGQDVEGSKSVISFDEIKRELQQFSKKFSIDYAQYVADAAALKAWRITGFPETFVFRREGKHWQLVRKYISEISLDELERVTSGSRS